MDTWLQIRLHTTSKTSGCTHLLALAGLVVQVRDPGLAAVVPVEVRSHEDTGTANRRLLAQAHNLVISINLVEFEDGELDLLVLVRDLETTAR